MASCYIANMSPSRKILIYGGLLIVLIGVALALAFFFKGELGISRPLQSIWNGSSTASTTTNDALYLIKGDRVYYNDFFNGPRILQGADAATFVPLSGRKGCALAGYARDKNFVYYFDVVIPGADPATFKVLEHPYAKDVSHVYYEGYTNVGTSTPSTIIDGVDPATFSVLHDGSGTSCLGDEYPFARDASHFLYQKEIQPDIDPNTFVYLNGMFAKDARHVFNIRGGLKPIPSADPATFVVIESNLAKDKNRVFALDDFFRATIVKDADPATFIASSTFAYDKNFVFDLGLSSPLIIEGADPHTFIALTPNAFPAYFKDKDRVYIRYRLSSCKGGEGPREDLGFGIKVLPNADPASFAVQVSPYSKDASKVFYGDRPIELADPATFSIFSFKTEYISTTTELARDKKALFLRGNLLATVRADDGLRIIGSYLVSPTTVTYVESVDGCGQDIVGFDVMSADPATFSILGHDYSADAAHVYYKGGVVEAADPASFVVLGNRLARDAQHIFLGERIADNSLGIDIPSFVFYGAYAKDERGVYYTAGSMREWRKISEADPSTFEVIPILSGETSDPFQVSLYAKDKNTVFYDGVALPDVDPGTFKMLGHYGSYSEDRTHVYYRGVPVIGADVSSFTADPNNPIRGEDAMYLYSDGKIERPTDEQLLKQN